MSLTARLRSKWQRETSRRLGRRMRKMSNREPLISFTFDDFPASALHVAGRMLAEKKVSGTYYTSFGLMNTVAPTGPVFNPRDIPLLLEQGHELGCHTYHHLHSYNTSSAEFEASILSNRAALAEHAPGRQFTTLSYPISGARPSTKRRCESYFAACRAGGQVPNTGQADLNALRSFFLEQSQDDFYLIEKALEYTVEQAGWLIFSTHDVCANPTPYGVTSDFFQTVVEASVRSGAKLVPVSEGLKEIGLRLEEPHIV